VGLGGKAVLGAKNRREPPPREKARSVEEKRPIEARATVAERRAHPKKRPFFNPRKQLKCSSGETAPAGNIASAGGRRLR